MPMELTTKLGRARLDISLARGEGLPNPGEKSFDSLLGGRDTLLRWLETRLGLQRLPAPQAVRVPRP